nr:transcription-associated protein 1-like [Aedes albopictus]
MRECQDSLYRMYTIPSVSVVDCFQESRQQVKCCLQMVTVNNSQSELSEALKLCVVKLFIGCNGISDQAGTGNDSGSSVPGNEGPDHQRF